MATRDLTTVHARAGPVADEVRCWVYREIGALFDAVPQSLRFVDDAEDPGGYPRTREAIRGLCAAFGAHPREEIEVEHVRLFVNAPEGVPAPPYASWYLDGRLLGPAAEWAADEYRGQSLELAGDAGQPADFIGTEFEYLHFLCRHQKAARLTGDGRAFDVAVAAEARFFKDHLVRWLPAFLRDIRRSAPGGVFSRVADLLEAFCVEEGRQLA